MKQAGKQIALCAVILAVFCVLCRLTVFSRYTVYKDLHPQQEEALRRGAPVLETDEPGVLRLGELSLHDGYFVLPLQAGRSGEVMLRILDSSGEPIETLFFRVGPLGTVFDRQSGGFTGDRGVMIAVTLFWVAVSVIMVRRYRQAKGAAYYAHSTIYFVGFSIFSAVTALLMIIVTLPWLLHPESRNMLSNFSMINSASQSFMLITMPPTVFFAILTAVSNIELLRHEKPRFQNVLGLAVGVFLILGEALGLYLFRLDFSGSELEWRIRNTLQNSYATVFVYFLCMLAGSVICGIHAARHQPALDRDFIIIPGCWFRRDGSLPPLLRGRVDRAVELWQKQKRENGKEAFLIPSGGQGKDEPMPEAEAMKRYLVARRIPEEKILPECRSRNTLENFLFAGEIIRQTLPKGKTAFATTNYHVFRSGLMAARAGLQAEGAGGKTKWWFWPNAFLRECAGMFRNRWKQEMLFLFLILVFFALLSLLL